MARPALSLDCTVQAAVVRRVRDSRSDAIVTGA